MKDRILNIAAYKFTPLTDLKGLRSRLLDRCRSLELRGTILLSPEGINLFLAGPPDAVEDLVEALRSVAGLADLEVKRSLSDHQPFNRMLVRIKKEIIAFGVDGVEPGTYTSPKLAARELKQWLDEGRPVTLLDTRNDYEVKLGTFQNALPIGVHHFRDFPDAVRRLPASLKEQPIVMFCTGGIRCEKAGPFMEREGFKHIHQLDGGILKYFEECGGAHYEGECFVFDQRVGLDPALHETQSAQCFHCLAPLTREEQEDYRYVAGQSCPHCYRSEAEERGRLLASRREAVMLAVNPLPGSQPYDSYRPLTIPEESGGEALLDVVCRVVPHIPRPDWEAVFARGHWVDAARQPVPGSQRVEAGQRYYRRTPDVVEPDVNGMVEVLHEDEALIVVNKPAPLPMHAGGRFNRNTLKWIMNNVYHPEKPRPAHRLDANTTGVLLFTRTRRFASRLQPQFERGQVEKCYVVRVQGQPEQDQFDCEAPISAGAGEVGGRTVDFEQGLASRTLFRVRRRDVDGTTLLEARPLTGRTNQIRVHLWHLGHPVCGDPVYLPEHGYGTVQTLSPDNPPMCLHAWKISVLHPLDQQRVEFAAPLPEWAT